VSVATITADVEAAPLTGLTSDRRATALRRRAAPARAAARPRRPNAPPGVGSSTPGIRFIADVRAPV